MGLIKAALSSANSTFKDEWLEFVTCEDIGNNVLMTRGKITRSGKNRGSENVLSNGSRIVVPEGFAMMIVDQGKVTEFSAEAGEFIYDSGSEPSLFYGKLNTSIKESIKQFGRRFKFGGEIPKDTRVYYVNLREITGNKFGTAQPVPFDDPKYQSIEIRYYGMYSLKVSDPIVLIQNLIGVNAERVSIEGYIPQLKSEFIMSLTSAMAKMAYEKNISFNKLPMYQEDLSFYMNDKLDETWNATRGLEIVTVALESISVDEEVKEKIKEYDKMYFAEAHGQGMMTAATADSMRMAANNEGGNAGMFMGMGVGGMVSGAMQAGSQMAYASQPSQSSQQASALHTWVCACGKENTGKFCSECGKERPQNQKKFCSECGQEVSGKFCSNCGNKI